MCSVEEIHVFHTHLGVLKVIIFLSAFCYISLGFGLRIHCIRFIYLCAYSVNPLRLGGDTPTYSTMQSLRVVLKYLCSMVVWPFPSPWPHLSFG
jgi:hypothetical protein